MTTMQQRRGSGAQWTATARALEPGEIGVKTDGDKAVKVGDGSTLFDALPDRLLPAGGSAGQVLTTDGSAASWEDSAGAVASVNSLTGAVSITATNTPFSSAGFSATTVLGALQELKLLIAAGVEAVLDYNTVSTQYDIVAGDPATASVRRWRGAVLPKNATGANAALWEAGDEFIDLASA